MMYFAQKDCYFGFVSTREGHSHSLLSYEIESYIKDCLLHRLNLVSPYILFLTQIPDLEIIKRVIVVYLVIKCKAIIY